MHLLMPQFSLLVQCSSVSCALNSFTQSSQSDYCLNLYPAMIVHAYMECFDGRF